MFRSWSFVASLAGEFMRVQLRKRSACAFGVCVYELSPKTDDENDLLICRCMQSRLHAHFIWFHSIIIYILAFTSLKHLVSYGKESSFGTQSFLHLNPFPSQIIRVQSPSGAKRISCELEETTSSLFRKVCLHFGRHNWFTVADLLFHRFRENTTWTTFFHLVSSRIRNRLSQSWCMSGKHWKITN